MINIDHAKIIKQVINKGVTYGSILLLFSVSIKANIEPQTAENTITTVIIIMKGFLGNSKRIVNTIGIIKDGTKKSLKSKG